MGILNSIFGKKKDSTTQGVKVEPEFYDQKPVVSTESIPSASYRGHHPLQGDKH